MTSEPIAFVDPMGLEDWFAANHGDATVLWIRIYQKSSSVTSVDWVTCVEVALCWGWIDGQKKSFDAESYLQRMTPRRPGSSWSKRNVEHVERLVAAGRMQPAGLAKVDAAKADGRWDAAYDGSANMTIPQDFLLALDGNPAARTTFDTLKRSALFSIYAQLHSAKKPATRANRMARMIDRLARGEMPH